MADPIEIELKLAFDPAAAARLSAWAALDAVPAAAQAQLSTYFDTPDGAVRAAGFGLRIRRAGRRRVQTLKSESGAEAGFFVRSEWERPVRGDVPVFDRRSGPLAERLGADTLGRIAPAFVTDIVRETRRIRYGEAAIVCDVDCGVVRADGRAEQLAELELELVEGPAGALFDLARSLDEQVPLRLSVLSKAERGYRLANEPPAAWKAEPLILAPSAMPAAAFRAISVSCLRQYRLNEDLLLADGGPEALHQARVGLRRLRSAFSLFGRLLPLDTQAERLRGELRWLAQCYGEVRNLDVLAPRMGKKKRADLLALRDARFATLSQHLRSPRVRRLMLDLAEWLALELRDAEAAPDDWVVALLDRRWKRLRRQGCDLAGQSDEARHQVRIEAKKLRYGAEFFRSLFTAPAARRRHRVFVKQLARLQDRLGDLNDLQTAADVLGPLGFSLPAKTRAAHRPDKLIARSQQALDRLLGAKPFWQA